MLISHHSDIQTGKLSRSFFHQDIGLALAANVFVVLVRPRLLHESKAVGKLFSPNLVAATIQVRFAGRVFLAE